MKQRWSRPVLILSGMIVTLLIAAILVICLFFPELLPARTDNHDEAKTEFFAMDTYITMTAYGRNAETALSDAEDKLIELEHLWSVTNLDSDIYAVNHSGGHPVSVSEETAELLSFALQMAEETDGALEPTIYPVLTAWGFTTEENRVPSDAEITELLKNVGYERIRLEDTTVQLERNMMLDLGSVGKGYAGDLATGILQSKGITSALLNLGGNVQAIGSRTDGNPWRIGIRDPFSEGMVGVLEIQNMAVVTSGNYERYFIGEDGKQYGHIIEPATGYPVNNGLGSITVIAKEGRLCDALSTSLYVMGMDRAVEYWKQHQNFEMIVITDDGKIYLTDGISNHFTLDNNHSTMKVHVITNK